MRAIRWTEYGELAALFFIQKTGKILTYQVFIEPKGKYLKEHDKWKENFLKEIREEFAGKVLTFDGDSKYRIVGVPFYDNQDENQFKESLEVALKQ